MAIDIRGIPIEPGLRTHVTKRLTRVEANVVARPVTTQVTFFDENGPKGGRAMRCAVTMRLPHRAHVHIEDIAETPRLAFDGAVEKLERELTQSREKDLEGKRHPKKYYTAKRLLQPEAGGPSAGPGRAAGRRGAGRRRV